MITEGSRVRLSDRHWLCRSASGRVVEVSSTRSSGEPRGNPYRVLLDMPTPHGVSELWLSAVDLTEVPGGDRRQHNPADGGQGGDGNGVGEILAPGAGAVNFGDRTDVER